MIFPTFILGQAPRQCLMIMVIRMSLRYWRLRALELSGLWIFMFLDLSLYPHIFLFSSSSSSFPPPHLGARPFFPTLCSAARLFSVAIAACCASCIMFHWAKYSLYTQTAVPVAQEKLQKLNSVHLSQHELLNFPFKNACFARLSRSP